MVDCILGVSDPQQWHSEVSFILQLIPYVTTECVKNFSWEFLLCVLCNLESEIEQRSLCLMDGAPWWGQTGTALSLSLYLLSCSILFSLTQTVYPSMLGY